MFGTNWYILVIIVTAVLTYLFLTGQFFMDPRLRPTAILKEKEQMANGALVQLAAVGPQDWYLTDDY